MMLSKSYMFYWNILQTTIKIENNIWIDKWKINAYSKKEIYF